MAEQPRRRRPKTTVDTNTKTYAAKLLFSPYSSSRLPFPTIASAYPLLHLRAPAGMLSYFDIILDFSLLTLDGRTLFGCGNHTLLPDLFPDTRRGGLLYCSALCFLSSASLSHHHLLAAVHIQVQSLLPKEKTRTDPLTAWPYTSFLILDSCQPATTNTTMHAS